jgi:predicted MFS family arabinose efflux permease
VILAFMGLGGLMLAQIAVYSFVERIGVWRGFTAAAVSAVLLGAALGSLVAPVLAGTLQRRWPALAVAFVAPLAHGGASFVITHAPSYWPYALATGAAVFMIQFIQVFIFALIARLDTSGWAPAATPAVLMMGAAAGPLLGGTVTAQWGFPAVGTIAAALALACSLSFFVIHRSPARAIANGTSPSAPSARSPREAR